MFDIHSITLEDFKSYAGKHEFVFPTEAGLYFLTGSNDVEPRLGSNGAGKSTLLDAIYWCLYGKTLRGLKASDVVTWGKKSCSVTVLLVCGHTTVSITRTQNPNSLELDSRPVEQKDIDKYIGLTPDAFTYSVMMPQYNQSFFELTPTNKLTLFSGILNLDEWLTYSKKAAELTAEFEAEINNHSRQIGGLEIAIEAAAREATMLEQSMDEFDVDHKKITDQIKIQMSQSTRLLAEVTEEHELLIKQQTELNSTIEELYDVLKDKEALLEKYKSKKSNLKTDIAVLASKLDAATKKAKNLNQVGADCPVCLQKVDKDHLKKESIKAEREAKIIYSKIDEQETELDLIDQKLAESTKQYSIQHNEITALQADERKCGQQIKWCEMEAATLQQKIDGFNIQIEKKPDNPYIALLAEKRSKLKGYKEKQVTLNSMITKLETEHEACSFWISGFKRLRLHIIEDTLNALEIEVNNSLTNLGLVGWSIEFDVERENKSGSITKGFVVLVRAPGQLEPTRLEAWSGGESQRLQLACDLGLANLIMQQAGLKNTIEFYDEPSKHLSKAGLVDLAETLHQRAIDDGKRIFLVDHNMPEFGEFADVITVTKGEEGSMIQ